MTTLKMKSFLVWIVVLLMGKSVEVDAQILLTDQGYNDHSFIKSMQASKVKTVHYNNDVFKLKVDYFLDTIKITRDFSNNSPGYAVKSTNNDTVYFYSQMPNSKYNIMGAYHNKFTTSLTIDYNQMVYDHNFIEHEMDIKLQYLALINYLNLKEFTKPTLVKID